MRGDLTLSTATAVGTLLNAFTGTGGTDTAFKLNHTGAGYAATTELLLDIQEGGRTQRWCRLSRSPCSGTPPARTSASDA